MIKLKRLVFNNIRRYTSEQEISFEERSNLLQIDGINHVTGGSSGSAKTTIALCIDYLFGVCDVPATQLQSRLTKEKGYVTGFFDVDGKELIIKRSMKTGKTLTVTFDGEETSGNTKLAEEKIDELIKIPRNLFKKIIHKRQGEGGFFLTMTAKQTYEFMSKALNLDKYEKAVQDIEKDISNNVDNLSKKEVSVSSIKESVEVFKNNLSLYNKPEKPDDYGADTESLENELNKKKQELTELSDKQSLMVSKIKKPEKPEVKQDAAKLGKLQEEQKKLREELEDKGLEVSQQISNNRDALSEAQNSLSKVDIAKDRLANISSKLKTSRAQLESLEKSKCPTCMQDWLDESRESKISALKEESKQLKLEALKNKKIVDSQQELEAEIESIKAKISKIETESESNLKDLKNALDKKIEEVSKEKNRLDNEGQAIENEYLKEKSKYDEKISAIKEKFSAKTSELKETISEDKAKLDKISYTKESYEKALRDYEKSVKEIKGSIEQKVVELERESSELEKLKKDMTIMEESRRLVKNYVLQKFQDTLDVIGENASQILGNIPNTVNTSVYFEGCKENKDGSIKEEVNAVISMDGEENIPYKTLCGGEANSINWAVDLAVIDVIETYGNTGVDFYLLDEPFNGLDSINRFELLEILKGLNNNKRMVVIDHAPELKEMVTDVIKVERYGEISSITQ